MKFPLNSPGSRLVSALAERDEESEEVTVYAGDVCDVCNTTGANLPGVAKTAETPGTSVTLTVKELRDVVNPQPAEKPETTSKAKSTSKKSEVKS